jgi:hypothetical protein
MFYENEGMYSEEDIKKIMKRFDQVKDMVNEFRCIQTDDVFEQWEEEGEDVEDVEEIELDIRIRPDIPMRNPMRNTSELFSSHFTLPDDMSPTQSPLIDANQISDLLPSEDTTPTPETIEFHDDDLFRFPESRESSLMVTDPLQSQTSTVRNKFNWNPGYSRCGNDSPKLTPLQTLLDPLISQVLDPESYRFC